MNAARKMVLIPEQEVKQQNIVSNVLSKQAEHQARNKKESYSVYSELQKLLESDVPSSLKMRLFNSLISTYLEKKDDKSDLVAKDSSPSEKSLIIDKEPEIAEPRPKKQRVRKVSPSLRHVAQRPKRARKPNKKYINDQFGTGKVIPIKWMTLKKF